MKLIKNSNELIDMEMIGLKNFQYYLNSSGCNSLSNNQRTPSNSATATSVSNNNNVNNSPKPTTTSQTTVMANVSAIDSYAIDLEMIINQNGITYEQLQTIIEDLLNENNYHIEHLRHLKYRNNIFILFI